MTDLRTDSVIEINEPEAVNANLVQRVDLLVLASPRPVADLRRLARVVGRRLPILMLSPEDDAASVIEAFRLGATGYLVDGEYNLSEFEAAVTRTAAGEHVVSTSATSALLGAHSHLPPPDEPQFGQTLTRREHDLLSLIAGGANNRQIAEALHLAERTVRNYASRLYAKLNVTSRSEAVVWALSRSSDE